MFFQRKTLLFILFLSLACPTICKGKTPHLPYVFVDKQMVNKMERYVDFPDRFEGVPHTVSVKFSRASYSIGSTQTGSLA
jgi:hypothetical protein